jgi:putative phosphoesterase
LKIGIVSDSHGDVYSIKRAITSMGSMDMIVHLGDFCSDAVRASADLNREIICVRGNCDFSSNAEYERIIEVEGKRILVTHGHKYNVKADYLGIHYRALEEKVDAVLFGHTHFPEVFERDSIVFVNPGSISRPRGACETYAIVTVDSGFIVPNILELY